MCLVLVIPRIGVIHVAVVFKNDAVAIEMVLFTLLGHSSDRFMFK